MPEKSRYSEFEKSKNEYLLERLKKAKEIEDKLIFNYKS